MGKRKKNRLVVKDKGELVDRFWKKQRGCYGYAYDREYKYRDRVYVYEDRVEYVLHRCPIATWYFNDDILKLETCGWYTYTTKERLNLILPLGLHVESIDGTWFLVKTKWLDGYNSESRYYLFRDGMRIKVSTLDVIDGVEAIPRVRVVTRKKATYETLDKLVFRTGGMLYLYDNDKKKLFGMPFEYVKHAKYTYLKLIAEGKEAERKFIELIARDSILQEELIKIRNEYEMLKLLYKIWEYKIVRCGNWIIRKVSDYALPIEVYLGKNKVYDPILLINVKTGKFRVLPFITRAMLKMLSNDDCVYGCELNRNHIKKLIVKLLRYDEYKKLVREVLMSKGKAREMVVDMLPEVVLEEII